MGKSVYSIVLSDEVVQAVDEMAYRMNTSRSNLINQLLAERVSLTTPEMRMREIFSLVGQALDSRFFARPAGFRLGNGGENSAEFQVQAYAEIFGRALPQLFGQGGQAESYPAHAERRADKANGQIFSEIGARRSRNTSANFFSGGFPCEIAPKSYTRDFYEIAGNGLADREIAEAISEYIRTFDKAITVYFENASDPAHAKALCEETYKGYLRKGVSIV